MLEVGSRSGWSERCSIWFVCTGYAMDPSNHAMERTATRCAFAFRDDFIHFHFGRRSLSVAVAHLVLVRSHADGAMTSFDLVVRCKLGIRAGHAVRTSSPLSVRAHEAGTERIESTAAIFHFSELAPLTTEKTATRGSIRTMQIGRPIQRSCCGAI